MTMDQRRLAELRQELADLEQAITQEPPLPPRTMAIAKAKLVALIRQLAEANKSPGIARPENGTRTIEPLR